MNACERCGSGGGPQPCVKDGLCCLCRRNLGLADEQRQILGSGANDFTPCDGCPDSICVMAEACLRQKAQT